MLEATGRGERKKVRRKVQRWSERGQRKGGKEGSFDFFIRKVKNYQKILIFAENDTIARN